jgi:hypothetical protein
MNLHTWKQSLLESRRAECLAMLATVRSPLADRLRLDLSVGEAEKETLTKASVLLHGLLPGDVPIEAELFLRAVADALGLAEVPTVIYTPDGQEDAYEALVGPTGVACSILSKHRPTAWVAMARRLAKGDDARLIPLLGEALVLEAIATALLNNNTDWLQHQAPALLAACPLLAPLANALSNPTPAPTLGVSAPALPGGVLARLAQSVLISAVSGVPVQAGTGIEAALATVHERPLSPLTIVQAGALYQFLNPGSDVEALLLKSIETTEVHRVLLA